MIMVYYGILVCVCFPYCFPFRSLIAYFLMNDPTDHRFWPSFKADKAELKSTSQPTAPREVNFFWSCDLSWRSDCEPQLSVKRLDAGSGFVQKRARKRKVNGVEERDAEYM